MNREILFRGFHECKNGVVGGINKHGEWVEGYPYKTSTGLEYIGYDAIINGTIQPFYENVIPSTVGQFTGLYDATKWESLYKEEQDNFLSERNYKTGELNTKADWKGKRIFEGDVVSDGVINYIVEFYGSTWVKRVSWASGGYSALHGNANRLTIIGNIFEAELIGNESNA